MPLFSSPTTRFRTLLRDLEIVETTPATTHSKPVLAKLLLVPL
jgi:hypothetical protein